MELWLTKGIWEAADAASDDPLDRPILDFAADALNRRHKKLLKLGGKKAKLAESELHDLRLEFKKMRYLAEFFGSLFAGKATRRYLKSMAAAQDRLGSLNDALVSRALLAQLEQKLHEVLGETETRRLGGLLLGWQAANIERDLDHFEDVWRNFRKQKRYWRKK
jgi:CHAD domain-containing protein